MDTAHFLPGELLDFPIVLQILTENAVVVLHDVACHQAPKDTIKHATAVLFSVVTAEKFLNFIPSGTNLTQWTFPRIDGFTYPNIAAFQVNRQTRENILDLFCALMLRWNYMPSKVELARYTDYIHKNFDETACRIYDEAVRANQLNLGVNDKFQILNLIPENSGVFIYSADAEIFNYINENRLNFKIVLPSNQNINLSAINYFVISNVKPTEELELYSRLTRAGFNSKRIITIHR